MEAECTEEEAQVWEVCGDRNGENEAFARAMDSSHNSRSEVLVCQCRFQARTPIRLSGAR